MGKESKQVLRLVKNYECNKEEGGSIIEVIWKYHTVSGLLNEEIVKEKMEVIQSYLKSLSQKRKRIIAARIADLCVEHERAAFIAGVRVGGRLIMELHGEDEAQEAADKE